jgi:hypothetical protein
MSNNTRSIAVIGASSIVQDHIALIQASPYSHLVDIYDMTTEAVDMRLK